MKVRSVRMAQVVREEERRGRREERGAVGEEGRGGERGGRRSQRKDRIQQPRTQVLVWEVILTGSGILYRNLLTS